MSEDVPVYNGPEPTVVTTDDGKLFHCAAYEMAGRAVPSQVRWKLTDAEGREYVGPPYGGEKELQTIQRLVSEWWAQKKALGQSGINAGILKTWLRNDD